jgi:RimJ/RimL family protein N-acetyltransferase
LRSRSKVRTIFEPIHTSSLVLVPLTAEVAEAVVRGDLSSLCAGEGWPHADTVDGLQMALRHGHEPGWLVTLDGVAIGDCGTFGPPDECGRVEIGYGLSAAFRGRGYGAELVAGLAHRLAAHAGVDSVTARVLPDNVPSRRALERAGFTVEGPDGEHLRYGYSSFR